MQHLLIILGYVLLSMAMGVALPVFVASVTIGEGLLAGLLTSLIGGLIHENIHRRKIATMQSRHMLLLKKAYDKTKIELLDLRNDIHGDRTPEMSELRAAPKVDVPAQESMPAEAPDGNGGRENKVSSSDPMPSFLADDQTQTIAQDSPQQPVQEEMHWLDRIDAEEAAEAVDGYDEGYHEDDYLDDENDEDHYEEDDHDAAHTGQETEVASRQALAREVEVLQGLVDKLYTDGLPEQVRDRAEDIEEDDGDLYADGLSRVKPHVDIDEAMLPIVREALEAKRLDALLQPIHTLPQRKRRFFEAFGRLRSRDGELLVPERIQMLIEEDGLNATADTLLLYRCAQILKQNGGLEFDRAIFCNVSPNTLADVSFLRDFSEYMEKRRTLARSLVLELDHETIDPIIDDLREPMGRLAGIGLRFALDNVRTTNLDEMALGRSHISYVKFDSPSLLALLKRQGETRFKNMRQKLEKENIELIGDHIASERMLMDVMDLGIEYGQGILFGEPKPVKDPSSGLRII